MEDQHAPRGGNIPPEKFRPVSWALMLAGLGLFAFSLKRMSGFFAFLALVYAGVMMFAGFMVMLSICYRGGFGAGYRKGHEDGGARIAYDPVRALEEFKRARRARSGKQ